MELIKKMPKKYPEKFKRDVVRSYVDLMDNQSTLVKSIRVYNIDDLCAEYDNLSINTLYRWNKMYEKEIRDEMDKQDIPDYYFESNLDDPHDYPKETYNNARIKLDLGDLKNIDEDTSETIEIIESQLNIISREKAKEETLRKAISIRKMSALASEIRVKNYSNMNQKTLLKAIAKQLNAISEVI